MALQRSGQSAAMMLAVRAPQSKPGDDRLLDLERIHQRDDVDGERRWLAIAERVARKKARRAIAAQIRNDHPVARRCQQGRDIDEAVNVVGPAVQKNDRRTIGGAGFGIADIEDAGIDLLQRTQRKCASLVSLRATAPTRTLLDCASAETIMLSWAAAIVMAAVPQKRRRSRSISFDILILAIASLLRDLIVRLIAVHCDDLTCTCTGAPRSPTFPGAITR